MGLFRESYKDRAHVRVLENTYVCLAFFSQNTKISSSDESKKVQDALSETLSQLTQVYSGAPVSYQDYEPIITSAREMSGKIWNPNMDSVANLAAALINSLDETGWQIDNEPELFEEKKIEIPDVARRLAAEQGRLGQSNEVELTPYQRMIRESDLRSIGEALDASESLNELNGKSLAPEHRSLARLNVEFISEPVLHAWLTTMAAKDALPKDPDCLFEALSDVERHFHAGAETKERLTEAWVKQKPELDRNWIHASASALLSSACSTKMDTLYHSSVDIVREQLESTYQKISMEAQEDQLAKQEAEGGLKEVQDALYTIETQLHRLESRLPSGVTSTAVQELKAATEKLTMKTEIALDDMEEQNNNKDDHRPT